MTYDLVSWLREQIADDRANVLNKAPAHPERIREIRATCDAHTAILDEHGTPHTVVDGFCAEEGGECTHTGENQCAICGIPDCRTVRALGLAYQHRPGYREEWRS